MDEWKLGPITERNKAKIHHIYHGAHIETATRILKDDAIRSTLVEDCAVLANTRLSVTWLTPNYFSHSIYGNVQFRIPFEKILDQKEIRWLELNTDFKLPRYRFAVCDEGSMLHKMSHPYDIHKDNGPLQLRSGVWSYNQNVVVELLLDDQVRRSKVDEIAFVQHYNDQTCRHGSNCPDKHIFNNRRKAYLLAYLLSSANEDWNSTLIEGGTPSGRKLNAYAEHAIEELWIALVKPGQSWSGPIRGQAAVEIVLAACALLSNNRPQQARSLVMQTASEREYMNALEHIVSTHFDISYKLPTT